MPPKNVVLCMMPHLRPLHRDALSVPTLMRLSRVIVGLTLDYRQKGLKVPPAMNPYAPKGLRRHLGFGISHWRLLASPVSYPRLLLHSGPLDVALTDLGLHFLLGSRRRGEKPWGVAAASWQRAWSAQATRTWMSPLLGY